jgi:hypothetical protein
MSREVADNFVAALWELEENENSSRWSKCTPKTAR